MIVSTINRGIPVGIRDELQALIDSDNEAAFKNYDLRPYGFMISRYKNGKYYFKKYSGSVGAAPSQPAACAEPAATEEDTSREAFMQAAEKGDTEEAAQILKKEMKKKKVRVVQEEDDDEDLYYVPHRTRAPAPAPTPAVDYDSKIRGLTELVESLRGELRSRPAPAAPAPAAPAPAAPAPEAPVKPTIRYVFV